jgi:hypothetical protein
VKLFVPKGMGRAHGGEPSEPLPPLWLRGPRVPALGACEFYVVNRGISELALQRTTISRVGFVCRSMHPFRTGAYIVPGRRAASICRKAYSCRKNLFALSLLTIVTMATTLGLPFSKILPFAFCRLQNFRGDKVTLKNDSSLCYIG